MTATLVSITEDWRILANAEQAAMAATRYEWLRQSVGADEALLDVAAGTAFGLRRVARSGAVAGDVAHANLRRARQLGHEGPLIQLDAQALPFAEATFDVICCLEAVYYLADQAALFAEAARVLRPGGRFLVSLPNAHRPMFDASAASTSYPDATELLALAAAAGLSGSVDGAFSWEANEPGWRRALRATVVRLHLMPRSMRAKSLLKRLVYRQMQPLAEAVLTAPVADLHEVTNAAGAPWTMLYLTARKPLT